MNRALRAHDALAKLGAAAIEQGQVAVSRHRGVDQLLTLGVAVDELNVVEDVAAVLDVVRAADADDVLGAGAEHPVGDVDLVRGELSGEAPGKLAVFAPILLFVGAPGRHRLVPRILRKGVAMPLAADVGHLADHAFVDHLLSRLVEL